MERQDWIIILGLILTIVGLGSGVLFFMDSQNHYSYLIRVAQNTVIEISTTPADDSIGIFVSGAVFSTGLSLLFSLIQKQK